MTLELEPMKRCCRCLVSKPLHAFWRNKDRGDGYHDACARCQQNRRDVLHADPDTDSPVHWDGVTAYSEPLPQPRFYVEWCCLSCGRFVARVIVEDPRRALLPTTVRCHTCRGLPVPNGEVYPVR